MLKVSNSRVGTSMPVRVAGAFHCYLGDGVVDVAKIVGT
jgi:hypothetical protein